MIKKYSRPTKLDKEPYATLYEADLESGIELWVQTGKEEPKWIRLGEVFEKNYHTMYGDNDIITHLLSFTIGNHDTQTM